MKKVILSLAVASLLGLPATDTRAVDCGNMSAPVGYHYQQSGGGCTLIKDAPLPEKSCTSWSAPTGYHYVRVPGTVNSCTLEKDNSRGSSGSSIR